MRSEIREEYPNYTVHNDEVMTRMAAFNFQRHRCLQVCGAFDLLSFERQVRIKRAVNYARKFEASYYPDTLRRPFTQGEIEYVHDMLRRNSIVLSDHFIKPHETI